MKEYCIYTGESFATANFSVYSTCVGLCVSFRSLRGSESLLNSVIANDFTHVINLYFWHLQQHPDVISAIAL